jgi:glyoxylase-like metal-dependent hydrolase (beta-lactamase superfamily II)
MIEEILENIYRIEIPLFRNPLKFLNSYVIKAPERSLVIDTGWNRRECLDTMLGGLREIGVNLERTDFFITHFHADHLGLVSNLAPHTATIYFNKPEADRIKSGIYWNKIIDFARKSGFPEQELQEILNTHPGYKYRSDDYLTFTILKGGDTLDIWNYIFKCIETPGHTMGHMCLYEPNKKIFVSGDHILDDITPNIQLWSDKENALKDYLASLEKVSELDIELVLPGHRGIIRNCKKRIEELKYHHQRRLEEVLSILEDGGQNAYQVASQMSWDIANEYDSWDLFPVPQKWFATGEAIAHLKYLEEEGTVVKAMSEHNILFSINI